MGVSGAIPAPQTRTGPVLHQAGNLGLQETQNPKEIVGSYELQALIQVPNHFYQTQFFAAFLGFASSAGTILRQAFPSCSKIASAAPDHIFPGVRPTGECHSLATSTQGKDLIEPTLSTHLSERPRCWPRAFWIPQPGPYLKHSKDKKEG